MRRSVRAAIASLAVGLALGVLAGGPAAAEPPTQDPQMHWWHATELPEARIEADVAAFLAPTAQAAGAGIFGPDDRVAVVDTLALGYRAIALLLMYEGERPSAGCTGTFISKNLVLTAAHCLYSGGKYATAVAATPGAAPGSEGLGTRQAKAFAVPEEWRTGVGTLPSDAPAPPSRHDWGLVVFEGDPYAGKIAPYPSVADAPDSFFQPGVTVLTTTGYPGDKPRGSMWTTQSALFEVQRDYLYTVLDVAPGQSGSPVFAEGGGSVFIAGLVTIAGTHYNVSPRFTPRVFEGMAAVCQALGCSVPRYTWLAGGPPLPHIPPGTLPVRGVAAWLSRD